MWRILIVDDDRKYRKILREHFERAGHHVCETGEGEAAIGLAETERPQVILLDFDLPDARGSIGLVRRLREKLGKAADCIQTVRGVGYRLDASGC